MADLVISGEEVRANQARRICRTGWDEAESRAWLYTGTKPITIAPARPTAYLPSLLSRFAHQIEATSRQRSRFVRTAGLFFGQRKQIEAHRQRPPSITLQHADRVIEQFLGGPGPPGPSNKDPPGAPASPRFPEDLLPPDARVIAAGVEFARRTLRISRFLERGRQLI